MTGRRAADLALREPRQRRTREQWDRILDAGVRLLEEGGYEAFTIAALCERAEVPPRALYARAATKDALFLAVYERGMSRVLAGHQACSPSPTAGTRRRRSGSSRPCGYLVRSSSTTPPSCARSSSSLAHTRRYAVAARSYRNAHRRAFAPRSPDPRSPRHDGGREREFCFSLSFPRWCSARPTARLRARGDIDDLATSS